ncbi:MAG: redoxin family protein [Chitinophagaceae bacterium]
MKKIFIACGLIIIGFAGSAQNHPDPSPLAIGASAPDFKLPGTDGKTYSLAAFKASPVLVIIFSCNHCPTAQAYEDRVIQLVKEYTSKGVAFAVISPNDPKAINLGELGYTDMSDTYAEMKIRYKEKGYNFPYLYDGDSQASSLKYGPIATPHAFVFDASRKLQYSGRLDANEKPGTGNSEDIRAALDAMVAGKTVAVPVTKTFGCSIKWAWKNEYNAKLAQEWAALPVELKDLDLKSVEAIVKNESSGKLRLINVWATWCGPCIQEIPDFITIDRMYRERDFEFITISLDQPEKKTKALERLKKMEASNTNYIFTEKDKYALIEKIDPKWQGALPYTLLVEPGGKIVYGKQGTINPQELKKIIVENKMIGRYY